MNTPQFFGLVPPPYFDLTGYQGKLIVIEGADGVGRTTQIERLKEWLEVRGHAVIETGQARSELVVPLILDERVVGVFDLQSGRPNAFSDADARTPR